MTDDRIEGDLDMLAANRRAGSVWGEGVLYGDEEVALDFGLVFAVRFLLTRRSQLAVHVRP